MTTNEMKSKHILEIYAEQGFINKSESTKETYLFILNKFNKWLMQKGTSIESVTFVDLQQYINQLQTTHNRRASTVNKEFNAIKHFCRFIKRTDIFENVKVVRTTNSVYAPKALNKNERNSMLHEANRKSPRDYAVICFLLYTGVRLSECHNCNIGDLTDIGECGGYVKIIGKGNKERVLPINSTVRQALNLYLKERGIDIYDSNSLEKHKNEPLFKSNYNKRLSKRSIQWIVETTGNTHAHTLRHTFATILLREKKYDAVTVAKLLGHSDLKILETYAATSMEDMSESTENMED